MFGLHSKYIYSKNVVYLELYTINVQIYIWKKKIYIAVKLHIQREDNNVVKKYILKRKCCPVQKYIKIVVKNIKALAAAIHYIIFCNNPVIISMLNWIL